MRWRWRTCAVLLGVVVALAGASGSAGAEPIAPCLNYVHREEAGRVEVDLRPDERTGTFTTLTMWWFIDEPGAAPGVYTWNHMINGRATASPNIVVKDDQLHTSLKMIDRHTGLQWQWGDIYTFQATHYSPTTDTTYVAAHNRCRITPRS
jgi:hypothetical protein